MKPLRLALFVLLLSCALCFVEAGSSECKVTQTVPKINQGPSCSLDMISFTSMKSMIRNSKGEIFYLAGEEYFIKKILSDRSNITIIAGDGKRGEGFPTIATPSTKTSLASYKGSLTLSPDETKIYSYDIDFGVIFEIDLLEQTMKKTKSASSPTTGIFYNGSLLFTESRIVKKLDVNTGVSTSLVGSLSSGSSPDGTDALSAKFGKISGIVIWNDDLYILDMFSFCIRRFSFNTSKVYDFVGNCTYKGSVDGIGTSAKFGEITQPTLLPNGTLYVFDGTIKKIISIDMITRKVTTIIGSGSTTFSFNIDPLQMGLGDVDALLAIATEGLLISLSSANGLYVYNNGQISTIVSNEIFKANMLPYSCISCIELMGMQVLKNGEIIFSCKNLKSILKLKTDGMVERLIGGGTMQIGKTNDTTKLSLDISGLYVNPIFENEIYFTVPTLPFPLYKFDTNTGLITEIGRTRVYNGEMVPARNRVFPTTITTKAFINPYNDKIFITEYQNEYDSARITAISNNKTYTFAGVGTYAGYDPTVTADKLSVALYSPTLLAFTSQGGIYFTEQSKGTIRFIDGTTGSCSLYFTAAADTNYVGLQVLNGVVHYLRLNGEIFTVTGATTSVLQNTNTNCVAKCFIIAGGNYYIGCSDKILKRVIGSTTVTTIAGGGATTIYDGITATNARLASGIDSIAYYNGELYFTYANLHIVCKLTSGGLIRVVLGVYDDWSGPSEGPTSQVRLSKPMFITFDKNGALYITHNSQSAMEILKFENGYSTVIAGGYGDGLPSNQSTLYQIQSISFNKEGELLFSIPGAVRKIRRDGIVSTVAGGTKFYSLVNPVIHNTVQTLGLTTPLSMAVDYSTDDLYLSMDVGHVSKLSANGSYTMFVSTCKTQYGCSFSGDGGLAIDAGLYKNSKLYFDNSTKELYLVDSNSFRVRKVDANGTIGTIVGTGSGNPLPGNIAAGTIGTSIRVRTGFIAGNGDNIFIADGLPSSNVILRIKGCEPGWTGINCDLPMCFGLANYSSAVCSGKGECVSPDICDCVAGYGGNNCQFTTCFGILNSSLTVCNGVGNCTSPNNCECKVGYSGNDCYNFICFGIERDNSSVCSGHGNCTILDICQCTTGYYENDCSDFTCYGIDRHNSSVCSGNGKCTGYNQCQCDNGYSATNCSGYICFGVESFNASVCSGHGRCLGVDNCSCVSGYYESDCSEYSCFGIERHNSSVCSGYGNCTNLDVCECITGYYENDCSDFTCFGIDRHNASVCSGYGKCTGYNQCICTIGYFENDCSDYSCFGVDRHNSSVCSGYGKCTGHNQCQCNYGYHENDCNGFSCFSFDRFNASVCSGHGSCSSSDNCSCVFGYYESDCSDFTCHGVDRHNYSVCSGHGKCIGHNQCQCTNGYYGNDCSDFECYNVDRHNSSVCSGHGNCTGYNQCICVTGYFESDCSDFACYGTDRHNSSVCSGHGHCLGIDHCNCFVGYFGSQCENLNVTTDQHTCYGRLSIDPQVCSGKGNCTGHNQCQCVNGYSDNDCSDYMCFNIYRNSSSVCSGKGTCTDHNQCQCTNGYYGNDCSDFECYNVDRHNSSVCSGKGVCTDNNQCQCINGYYGNDCSDFTCHSIGRNSSSVCHGHGICVNLDICKCNHGYYGNDCFDFTCFSVDRHNSSFTCSGHGICLGYDNCSCVAGYYESDCSDFTCHGVDRHNYSVCSGHGKCIGHNQCQCTNGYYGNDCSDFECYNVDRHNSSVCSGHGLCTGHNQCQCTYGYYESDCSDFACHGTDRHNSSVCSGHGHCLGIDHCNCFVGYFGSQCENLNVTTDQHTCYGRLSIDPQVCSGSGICTSKDVCKCSNATNSIISGLNCENKTCVENYYQSSCSKYCRNDITCSSKGTCSNIDGSCECFSDSKNGFFTGIDCSSCKPGYYGDNCLTVIVPHITYSNDGDKLNLKIFAPYYYTSSSVDCAQLVYGSNLTSLGYNPSCSWTNKTSGEFTITLGYSNSILIGSTIGINTLIFNQIKSNREEYLNAIVYRALNPTPPIAIISTVTNSFSSCAEIQIIGSSSYALDNQLLHAYKWSILKSPQVIQNVNFSNPVLNLPSQLTFGEYSVQLIVTSSIFKVDSLPVVYNFTKQPITIPQVGISYSSQVDIQIDRVPYFVKKFVTFSECNENDILTSSLLNFEWKQLEGPSVNYNVLSDGNLLINSFSSSKSNKYIFEVILHYKGYTSNARLIVNSQEPKLEIGLYQVSLNISHVEISVEIDPIDSIAYYNSIPWTFNCIDPVSNAPCETFILNQLNEFSISKSQFVTIPSPSKYKTIQITLQVGGSIGEITITFPEGQSVPVINTISVTPQRTLLTTYETLSVQILISLDGQTDDIDSLIQREWLLNNQSIPANFLLSTKSLQSSNLVILDLSIFGEGTSHVLTCKVTSISSKLSSIFTYSFSIANNPKPCFCSISPSTGYALETAFTISCDGCLSKDTTLKFGFVDSKTNLKIALMEGTSSQITLPLPYTGTEPLPIFTTITNTQTQAKSETNYFQSVKIPTAANIVAIKKKKAAWETLYKSLAAGDPKKLVFGYIIPTVDGMTTLIGKRSLTSNIEKCMNGGIYNEITKICTCPSGFKKNDCSMTLEEWIDTTSSKWSTSKMVFDSLNSKSEQEIYTETLLTIQTSFIYLSLEKNDEVNQDLYDVCFNLFRNQVRESLKQPSFTISSSLAKVMFNAFRFIIGTKFSLQSNQLETPFTNDILEIANDLITFKLRNQLIGVPLRLDMLFSSIIANKIYPNDLSNGRIVYGDREDIDSISFGNMMTRFIPNVNLRKVIYQKVTRQTNLNITTIETIDKSKDEEVSTLIKTGTYSLGLDVQNQHLVIPSPEKPIAYNFQFLRSVNDSTQIQVIGEETKNTSIQSLVQCSSIDVVCDIDRISEEHYVCKCGQPTRVTLMETITTRTKYLTNVKHPQPPQPNYSTKNSSELKSLGYLGLTALIIPTLLSIICCIAFIIRKYRKDKKEESDDSNNFEMRIA